MDETPFAQGFDITVGLDSDVIAIDNIKMY